MTDSDHLSIDLVLAGRVIINFLPLGMEGHYDDHHIVLHVAKRNFFGCVNRLWKFFTTLLAITRLLDFWVHYPTLPYPKLKNHYPSGPAPEGSIHESMMYLLKYSLNSWASSSSKGHCNLEKLNIEYYGDDDGDNDGYDDEESDD